MRYSVEYKDLGRKDFKETWDYQADIFRQIVDLKKKSSEEAGSGENVMPGTLIFVEHPHVYTLGKSGSESNLLLDPDQIKSKNASFYKIDRGGDITYHGPGQIVGYPVFDLESIEISLKEYINRLEEAIIRSLKEFGLTASRLKEGTGVWFDPEINGMARKICAIGVKASRYVTMHGFAFNVNTDLAYFNSINPCGFTDKRVTSLAEELGTMQDMELVKCCVKRNLQEVFDLKWVNQDDGEKMDC